MNTILALAQDPGGAEAIEPVLTRLQGHNDLKLHILASKHACSIFSQAGLELVECNYQGWSLPNWQDFAEDWLKRYKPNLLLTATSNAGLLERAFIRVAKKRGLKTLTVIDFWSNYAKRFFVEGEDQLSDSILPHEIATIDEFSIAEMNAIGFPADMLHITGQPAFDKFVIWSKSKHAKIAGQRIRKELQLVENARLIVFFSQYISDMYPLGSSAYRGYTEFDVLSDLIALAPKFLSPIFIAAKTHPKEEPDKFDELLLDAPSYFKSVANANADALIMAADLLVGMSSTALVKGIMAGRKILSYQPNLVGKDELVLSRMGILETLRSRDELVEKINELIENPEPIISVQDFPDTWLDGHAVDRIMQILDVS